MLKSYRYLYFSAHVWAISSESWNRSHFVVQETHSSSILYLDPGKCNCKEKCSCVKSPVLSWCVFLQLITVSGTHEFQACLKQCLTCSLCSPFFLVFSFPPSQGSLLWELTAEKTYTSYHCDSISHSQCHQAPPAGLLNKLGDKTGAEDAHNTSSSTLPD